MSVRLTMRLSCPEKRARDGDWQVFADGQPIGRIYRTSGSTRGEVYHWSIYGDPWSPRFGKGPQSGFGETLEAAKAGFRACLGEDFGDADATSMDPPMNGPKDVDLA